MTTKINLFSKVLDFEKGRKPVLEIEDFKLSFFHPDDLPKSATLKLVNFNANLEYLQDSRMALAKQYEALRDVDNNKIDDKNRQKRQEIFKQLRESEAEIQNELIGYLEILSRSTSGELNKKLAEIYDPKNKETVVPDIERDDLIDLLFKTVQESLSEYMAKQTEKAEAEAEAKGFGKQGKEKEAA